MTGRQLELYQQGTKEGYTLGPGTVENIVLGLWVRVLLVLPAGSLRPRSSNTGVGTSRNDGRAINFSGAKYTETARP